MHSRCHQIPMRTSDHAPVFHQNLQRIQRRSRNHLLIQFPDPFTHRSQVHRTVLRSVWNSNSPPKIHKFNPNSQLLLQTQGQIKQHPRRLNEELTIQLVRCHHRVQSKATHTRIPQPTVPIKQLRFREAVLRLLRLSNDHIAFTSRSWVVPETQ